MVKVSRPSEKLRFTPRMQHHVLDALGLEDGVEWASRSSSTELAVASFISALPAQVRTHQLHGYLHRGAIWSIIHLDDNCGTFETEPELAPWGGTLTDLARTALHPAGGVCGCVFENDTWQRFFGHYDTLGDAIAETWDNLPGPGIPTQAPVAQTLNALLRGHQALRDHTWIRAHQPPAATGDPHLFAGHPEATVADHMSAYTARILDVAEQDLRDAVNRRDWDSHYSLGQRVLAETLDPDTTHDSAGPTSRIDPTLASRLRQHADELRRIPPADQLVWVRLSVLRWDEHEFVLSDYLRRDGHLTDLPTFCTGEQLWVLAPLRLDAVLADVCATHAEVVAAPGSGFDLADLAAAEPELVTRAARLATTQGLDLADTLCAMLATETN